MHNKLLPPFDMPSSTDVQNLSSLIIHAVPHSFKMIVPRSFFSPSFSADSKLGRIHKDDISDVTTGLPRVSSLGGIWTQELIKMGLNCERTWNFYSPNPFSYFSMSVSWWNGLPSLKLVTLCVLTAKNKYFASNNSCESNKR